MAAHAAYHLYLTMRHAAKTGTPFVGEVAVTGWRIGCQPSGTAPNAYNSGTIDLNQFTVNDAANTSTTTHLNKIQPWTGDSGVLNINVTDGDQDGLAELAWAYANEISAELASSYTLQDIRLYALGSNGKAVTPPCLYTPISPLDGSAAPMPPNMAVAMTTRSATVGRKGRGRWYVGPVSSNLLASSGLISGTYAGYLLTAAQNLMEGIRGVGGGAASSYTPVIWHRGTTTASVINKLSIGDEFDVMNSRRRQRKETYTDVTLT